MGIQNHLTCLLRNLYAGQEATVKTRRETTDWFQIRKGVHQAVFCHLTYLTYIQSTSCEMLGGIKYKLETAFSCRNREVWGNNHMEFYGPV